MEDEAGSLEVGKQADFVVLDQDLMKTSEKNLLNTKVLATYLGGQKLFSRPNQEH